MAANTSISVTGLDFSTIRANLQSYIAGKPDFADFNFDDSAISTLLDLLAYNTYYNAFYANMAANESFMDTAQLYENVASHAKELGYTVRSAQGATANVQIVFNSAVATDVKGNLTIPKNTEFTSSVNGVSYSFVTPTTYTLPANTTNGFSGHVEIIEGIPIQSDFIFTTANTEFVLQNDDVDTRSISVQVTSSGTAQTYNLASDLNTTNSSSQVFFVETDRAFRYKVLFGDGVMGKKPLNNDIVTIDYRVCTGNRTNGANTFSSTASIDGETDYTIVTAERATGGVAPEGIEDIRFNAPRAYETQNRAVTSKDYERIIIRENAKIQAARVWGGEENDPPIYGKVYACVKPKVGTVISSSEKNRININLEKYNVQSIDVEFVDPTYMYIKPTLQVRFDPEATSKTSDQIGNAVATQVINYETNFLNSFDGVFRYSRFLDLIDSSDPSIVGSQASISAEKRFRPTTSSQNYVINFNRSLEHPHAGHQYAISSTSFTFKGTSSCYFDDDGNGILRVYYLANRSRIYVEENIGTVDYDTGQVKLKGFSASDYGTDLSMMAKLVAFNVKPIRNQVLLISGTNIDVINDDTNLRESRIRATTIGSTTSMNETNLLTLTSY